MAEPRLYLNHLADLDWLIALEYGRVDDAQPPENWRGVNDAFGFLHDGPHGPAVGFKILSFSEFDADDDEVSEIWAAPRFDTPTLGLKAVTAGEIVLAARSLFDGQSSINRQFFSAAINAETENALALWLACLQAGDAMAHFGLGYTLYEVERFPEAYRHLRHYTEIAPCGRLELVLARQGGRGNRRDRRGASGIPARHRTRESGRPGHRCRRVAQADPWLARRMSRRKVNRNGRSTAAT